MTISEEKRDTQAHTREADREIRIKCSPLCKEDHAP